MKIDKISYQKAFVIGPYLQHRIGVEIFLDEGEKPESVLSMAKGIVDSWHKAQYPEEVVSQNAPVGEIVVDRGNPKAALEADIKSCMEIKVLESYKFLVRNDAQLQKVYDEKLAELKK